jgi:septum formation protein
MDLVLASRSPQRHQLLATLGFAFRCQPAHVDETPLDHEPPRVYVTRVATAKAMALAAAEPQAFILAADTPISVGRRILQTPTTPDEARTMLRWQSGRRVHIDTAVVGVAPGAKPRVVLVKSWVKFGVLSDADLDAHIDAGHWQGVAGGIRLEHMQHLVMAFHGSYSGILGLPLYETARLLAPFANQFERVR